MTKRPIPSVSDDLKDVLSLLTDWGIIKKDDPGNVQEVAKTIHAATYSLILWRFRLSGLKDRGKVFIEEIASDALQILPQVLMGYSKTATLLTRGIVENVLRHIYFSDHPVEFQKMNREKKWFMTVEDLFAYVKGHPEFEWPERHFDAINRLATLHSDLSAGVHGRSVRDLEMKVALTKIRYEDAVGRRHAAAITNCAAAANFALAVFHRDKLHAFQTVDRRIILRSMPAKARETWKMIQN